MTDQLSDNEQLVESIAMAAYEAGPSHKSVEDSVRAQLVSAGVVKLVPREKTTGERIAKQTLIDANEQRYPSAEKELADAIDAALAEMKERCAKVVECWIGLTFGGVETVSRSGVAAAIRALK